MSSRAGRMSALAALKARREGGTGNKKPSGNASDSDSDALYDEVSEDEYASIVRGRMMDDDFIEDDDGSGYVDDGRDDLEGGGRDDEDEDTEDEQEYYERTGKRKPKKGTKAHAAAAARKANASNTKAYASTKKSTSSSSKKSALSTTTAAAKRNGDASSASRSLGAYRPAVSGEKEQDFMLRLMSGLEGGASAAPPTPSPASRGTTSTLGSFAAASRKRKPEARGDFAAFRPTGLHGSSPSSGSGAPSSDPLEPPSDDVGPDVHITGSDTPPWHPDAASDDDAARQGPNKRVRVKEALPRAVGAISLAGAHDDDGDALMDIADAPGAFAAALEQTRKGGKAAVPQHDDDDDDSDDGFSIRTNVAGKPAARASTTIVNAAAVRPARAAPAAAAVPAPLPIEKLGNISAFAAPPRARMPATSVGPKLGEGVAPASDTKSWQSIAASLKNVDSADAIDVSSKPAPRANTKAAREAAANASGNKAGKQLNVFEKDGKSVRFYWLDYAEQGGNIFLTGKAKARETGTFVSATLDVQGIERCVYLQPRIGADGKPSSEEDVYDEFDSLRSKYGIKRFMAKWVTRKYAFEVPGVPAEGEYLKVKYGFDEPELPAEFSGATFARAFGTNTSAFELFVVKRGIMGPCWLDVREATLRTEGPELSWCKAEIQVDEPKSVRVFSDDDATAPREAPPMTIMSLSGRTIMNNEHNKREIVCVSAQTWADVKLEETTPPEDLPSKLFTIVRPLGEQFPPGFEAEAKKATPTRIVTAKYERMLLNQLLAQIHLMDPDIIVSHEFSGVFLDVLLKRIGELKADHWSRIGRFKKQRMPSIRAGFKLTLVAGRLVCDLASDTAKGIIPSVTWSLTEMCATHLKAQREDIDPDDTAAFFDHRAPSPARLLNFVRHCEVDAFLQMALATKVQILPLTRQLTNLAGNSWARCLNGGRAERNDFILLHDFHRQKYICPDKPGFMSASAKRKAAAKADHDGGAGEDGAGDTAKGAASTGKQPKFTGGLVFEPKRGLYDRYVIVMDFNSLYPSIIQEFNIDFTTVDRTACNANSGDVSQLPELPSSDVKQGVLPRLIATLVARRRQVKSLMKDKKATPAQQLQWNIKQLALKLTANSMYGCLGFEMSRFYARPLAALTTFKGREVLVATKELAESMSLDVIYGDTDSVMINTNATDLKEAMRIGAEFRKAVNERYRLLEIDIDAVFQRMLLVQKKKYAALKVEDGKSIIEVKGLDQKRREFCALSKNISSYVLDQILSGEPTETVLERIHAHLEEQGNLVREGKIQLEDFIIYKQLSKAPSEYNTSTPLPHVKVALRGVDKGTNARAGDVIPYVFCLGEDGSSASKSAQADRAFHPNDLRKAGSTLAIDFEHYLALQILPPVERLCENIEGTDRMRLAECLGLDASRYASHTSHAGGDSGRDFVTLDSQVPDEVRYAKCDALKLRCSACNELSTFEGLAAAGSLNEAGMLTPDGICCTNAACRARFGLASISIQLERAVRAHIATYYDGWSVCTEPACATQTRLAGVYARRCLAEGCRGKTELRYGDKALYTQLCYYEALVDVERTRTIAKGRANFTDVVACSQPGTSNAKTLDHMHATVRRYLDKSGRRFVALEKLFASLYVRPAATK